ncbi:MAG TPA: hypothetical protein VHC19_20540 [Pirellulales bacterium]|nr:hypothetical protein [Pirellulales bacterium]
MTVLIRIGELTGWRRQRELPHPTEEEIKLLAKDAIADSGTHNFLKQVIAATAPEERRKLKISWEEQMAARRSTALGQDTLKNPQK